jgi:hypothetical protein
MIDIKKVIIKRIYGINLFGKTIVIFSKELKQIPDIKIWTINN